MTDMLWTSAEIAAAVRGSATTAFDVCGVSIDSRSVEKGDLFVALSGPNFDGHDFVAAALAKGAAGALVARRPANVESAAPLVIAGDTLAALQALGSAARARSRAKFVAVTGSVGKTGTKEALRVLLERQAPTFASPGNLNNHWGAPLSLARMPRGASFGVFELGMNHAGEIRPLARMVRPHVAIITNIAAVHSEFFRNEAEIADAKAEILEGLEQGGVAVLPRDSQHFARLKARAEALRVGRIVAFGTHAESDARLISCAVGAEGNSVEASILGNGIAFSMGAPGRHLALNAMAVLAAIAVLGADLALAAGTYAEVKPLKGRGRREIVKLARGGSLTLIDESYNASPTAMRAALSVLAAQIPAPGGRRIAVLGDMRELGAAGAQLHRALLPDLIAAKVDLCFLVGPLMRGLFDALPAAMRAHHAAESNSMAAPLKAGLKAGDVILVKGSLGTRMAPLVEMVRAMGSGSVPRASAANDH